MRRWVDAAARVTSATTAIMNAPRSGVRSGSVVFVLFIPVTCHLEVADGPTGRSEARSIVRAGIDALG